MTVYGPVDRPGMTSAVNNGGGGVIGRLPPPSEMFFKYRDPPLESHRRHHHQHHYHRLWIREFQPVGGGERSVVKGATTAYNSEYELTVI